MIVILTEKPSAARNFAKALGGSGGTYNREKYLIVSARGHLLAYSTDLTKQVPEELADKYKKWSMENLPWEYKDYEGHEKGLLRQAMQGVLPTEVLWRKKSPYPKTWNPAYLNAVSAMLRSAMQDPDAPLLRIAKRAALEQLLTAAETATPWYGQLMTTPQTIAWFVQLNYWLQKYRVELV